MSDAFFRANAGACVIDARGRVLALRRKGVPENAWQMPQGGIEDGESPRAAVLRELREETGIDVDEIDIAAEYPDWLVYELPKEWRRPKVGWGQAQKWFLISAANDVTVRPDGKEFDAFEWLDHSELMARVIEFRRPVYERVLAAFLGQAPR